METKKELTTKEKILRALDEPNRKPSRMVGGLVATLIGVSLTSPVELNKLSKLNTMEVK